MQPGSCDTHHTFFKWVFSSNHNFISTEEGFIEKRKGKQLFIGATVDGIIQLTGPVRNRASTVHGELFLAKLSGHHLNELVGRALDRHWIDFDLIRDWIKDCEREHGPSCHLISNNRPPRPRLPLLIDTVKHCLVQTAEDYEYAALSYVWGNSTVLKTTVQNLESFCEPEAFLQTANALPRTIRDAMGVVQLLGKRYLWVDALCIVQDDENIRHALVTDMAAVFANATFTIVAADGTNADSGLKGLRGITNPRDNPCVFDWPDGTQVVWPSKGGLRGSEWDRRGWTFQEYVFSRRRLIFIAGSVRWECREACFCEEHHIPADAPTEETSAAYERDVVPIRMASLSKIPAFPSVESFKTLVSAYCKRHLTCDEDSMDAFLGITTALAPSFCGGFCWGVPVMFLDICLIWRSIEWDEEQQFRRRWNPRSELEAGRRAPMWSWAAWQGNLEDAAIWRSEDFILWHRNTWYYSVDYVKRVVPTVRWHTRATKASPPLEIAHQNEWHACKIKYCSQDSHDSALPPGWTRWQIDLDSADDRCPIFSMYTLDRDWTTAGGTSTNRAANLDKTKDKFPPAFYYTHASMSDEIKFNYPVPLRGDVSDRLQDSGKEKHADAALEGRYLCCSTHRAYFELDFLDYSKGSTARKGDYGLVDPDCLETTDSEMAHGFLYVHDPSFFEESDRKVLFGDEKGGDGRVELVAISMMYRQPGRKRWEEPLGRERPQSYNVLWVEWIDGIAYRKGIGEVRRDVWESRERELVDLILG